jgi:hypothetical protein
MAILNVFAIIVAGLRLGVNWLSPRLFTQPLSVFRILFICQQRSGARVGKIHAVLVHPLV